MRQPVERARVRINAQISTISPQLHVSNTVSWGDYSALRRPVSLIFSPPRPAKAVGCVVKIDHFAQVSGRHLSAPPLAYKFLASTGMNQMVAT